MLRVDRSAKTLKLLGRRGIPDSGLKERDDIQAMIRRSPEPFFSEMGEKLLLVGEEVRPTEIVDDRIDLLAIDPEGAAVVIELKRSSNKLQLLQALGYAAMVSKWNPERLFEERSKFASKTQSDGEDEIEQFLTEDVGEVNRTQRVILIAEKFDWEVLATAEWLSEKYGVDIRCYRIELSADGESEFLSCTCIYPPPELTDQAIKRRESGGSKPPKWLDWDAALASVENKAVAEFFRSELAGGQENYLRKRVLYFRIDGSRRFFVAAHRKSAYVWQYGRFPGDIEYWRKQLGSGSEIEPVKDGQCLRLFLREAKDFTAFGNAVKTYLPTVEFLGTDEELAEEAP